MAPDGMRRFRLRTDLDPSRGAFYVEASGNRLSLPTSLALQTPVTVQLGATHTSTCWDVDLTTPVTSSSTHFHADND